MGHSFGMSSARTREPRPGIDPFFDSAFSRVPYSVKAAKNECCQSSISAGLNEWRFRFPAVFFALPNLNGLFG
jgi:hypothetical protein